MKLQKYFLLTAILGLATFTSCSEDDGICEPLKLSFSVKNLGNTSASVDNAGVGLWISSTSVSSLGDADVAKNQKFIPNGQDLTAEGINWTGQEKLYTYAYYPYSSSATSSPESYSVSASSNPNLMWAKAETTFNGQLVTPKLAFSHLMSKLVINVKSDAKESGALAGGSVTLNGFKDAATANLLNGQITATGSASDVAPTAVTAASGYEGTYEAVLAPQSLEAGAEFLTMVTTGNVTIKGALSEALTLPSGQQVTLEVILKEEECVVKVQEIKAWTEDATPTDAVAEKFFPSYELLDLYDNDGIQGIVISLDEDSEGKHGWIVSLDEAELAMKRSSFGISWGATLASPSQMPTNGYWAKYIGFDANLDNFPAAQWVDNKNASRVTAEILENEDDLMTGRWTLPSSADAHFKAFVNLVFDPTNEAYEANVAKFNASIEAATAENKNKLPEIDWTDEYASDIFYWSGAMRNAGKSYAAKITPATYAYYFNMSMEIYQSDALQPQVQKNSHETAKVRAFHHF